MNTVSLWICLSRIGSCNEIHDGNVAEKWKYFRLAWGNYALTTEKKSEPVQVATLLTTIREEARDVFSTFDWPDAESKSKIGRCCKNSPTIASPAKTGYPLRTLSL